MTNTNLNIRRIDSRREDIRAAMAELRARLSPEGNVVSEAGRRRTIEVFGEPLSPAAGRRSGSAATWPKKGWRPCSTIRPASTRPHSRAETLRVPEAELAEAHAGADPQLLAAVRRIAQNIREFQQAILHRDVRLERPGGYLVAALSAAGSGGDLRAGRGRRLSLDRADDGRARPSGRRAEQLAVVAPPTKFGAYNPDMLATCHELGITEVYRLGGAQAVAALAYGVEGIPRVDKIVGPGNLFVALAKKYVFGAVAIDSIAGPSEVVVIVDESTRPELTAMDLIAQAEHAPGASVLIGWNERVLDAAVAELSRQLGGLERGELARQSLEEFGAVILARDADEACALADEIAPEHLHIATENAEAAGREDSPRRGDVLGQLYARGPGRLCRRARRTCCPPAAPPALPADCRPTTSCGPTASCTSARRA